MDRASILEAIVRLTAETLEVDEEALSEDTTFDDLDADSFDKLELVTALEDEFGMRLDDEVLEAITSIREAVDAVENAQ
ncbi:MAG: acyl carrier protein [Atopobiaceae bacterium]|nr:acyl carrier protein [Atopobiaceae bacterium]MBR3384910.1 acyl carrier protein [Atopobiaceae bacterium]